jgi:phytanoyl-CoA hydroxylase
MPIFAQLISLPVLHRFIELVLEEPCVATQSLYFPFGSAQGLHRDPWFVVTTPVSTLFAAWIALEDICVESGPLSFVPGSHRLSYKPLNTGDIIFHEKEATDESRAAHVMDMHAQISSLGLEQKLFLAKQGEILVWHGSLVHGGSKIAPVPPTRESFVVHFDAAKNRKRVAQGLNYDGQSLGVIDTNKINNIDGKLYFENPALGKALLSLKPKG